MIKVQLKEDGSGVPLPYLQDFTRDDRIECIHQVVKFAATSPSMDREVIITENGQTKYEGLISALNIQETFYG